MFFILKENKRFFKQILKLSKSELIKTYKGAALGPMWALIKPVVHIFVFWFAIELGLRSGRNIHDFPFVIFLMVGIIPWFFIQDAILDGANSIRRNNHFVTKMPFPVSTVMTFVTLSKIYVHIGLTAIVYIILLILGYAPSVYNLQIFFYMPMMYIFFTCLTWITAPLSCISKDFINAIKSIITAIFWLSGIIWDTYSLPKGLLKKMILLNPVNYIVNGYRNTFLYNKWFFESPYELAGFLACFIAVVILGSLVYKRLMKRILDVI